MILRSGSHRGFVLPVLLGVVLLAALLAVHSAAELGTATLLATQRQLNQRAFEAGESGIVAALEQLRMGNTPAPVQTLSVASTATDSALVQTTVTSRDLLPVEHSAGRIIDTGFQIRSTGRSARNAQVTVTQGAQQLRTLPASGQPPDLPSGLGASFTIVDTDSDGSPDRIYTGDRDGRLWRLDLLAGSSPATWMQPTLLADFSVPGGGRGFVAAPDITRVSADGAAWLQIAIGTANTGNTLHDQRFYVLRDSLHGPPATAAVISQMSLGSAQVLAQSLTLDGMTWFTAVEQAPHLPPPSRGGPLPTTPATLSVSALRTSDSRAASATAPSVLRQPLDGLLPANAGVQLAAAVDAAGRVACHVDTRSLPDCFLDYRPQRTWWRREDTD